MNKEVTVNRLTTSVENWGYVRNILRFLEFEYIESPEFEVDGVRFKMFCWFSTDDGHACRHITEYIGGEFKKLRNGKEEETAA